MNTRELTMAQLSLVQVALTCNDPAVLEAAYKVACWLGTQISPTSPPASPVTPSGTDGTSTAQSGHLSSATGT